MKYFLTHDIKNTSGERHPNNSGMAQEQELETVNIPAQRFTIIALKYKK